MRHAVLGAGGIGGLVAAALARSGADVVLLLRPASLERYGGRLQVGSEALGDFEVFVPATGALDRPVDVLWIATKAHQLESALALASREAVGDATVIPFLNGVDHMEVLRRHYRSVAAAAIRLESERVAPGVIRHKWPFRSVDIAGAPAACNALTSAGFECHEHDDERRLLWSKFVFLAPVALATSAFAAPLGAVRDDAEFTGCRAEAFAAAREAGVIIDETSITAVHERAPDGLRSSMQKDVAAGREPELDALAKPITRSGREHGFATPFTERLVAQIETRLRSFAGRIQTT
jgi:2-dehydropantoate 2-reductase